MLFSKISHKNVYSNNKYALSRKTKKQIRMCFEPKMPLIRVTLSTIAACMNKK